MSWENRKYERTPFRITASLTLLPDGPTVEIETTNLSAGGIGAFSPLSLEAGQMVQVGFPLQDENGQEVQEWVRGQVAYGAAPPERLDLDGRILGIQFDDILRETDYPQLWRALQHAMQNRPKASDF